tara:strand:- start:3398 stop:3571 length:174 start_codon:yes stop_codon:yes gene_type:complete
MPTTKNKKKIDNKVLGVRQNIRLDDEMLEQVSDLAQTEERSVSQMLRILVRDGLSQR